MTFFTFISYLSQLFNDYSKGSVIALLKMKFNPAFNENKTQLLEDAVKSGKVGSLDVDKESFKIIGTWKFPYTYNVCRSILF